MARRGPVRWAWQARQGLARLGEARQGRRGVAGRGPVWCGLVRQAIQQRRKEVDEIKKELADIISGLNGRNLSPADVVAYAKKNKEGAIGQWLDKKGCWNVKQAAEKFALLMAQDLIRRVKVYIEPPSGEPVYTRAFVSLEEDRQDGGGYRQTLAVMNAAETRAMLLRTAMRELEALRDKYKHLKALGAIWDAIDQVSVPA